MLPQMDNNIQISTTNIPSLTYKLNVSEYESIDTDYPDTIQGFVDRKEAIKQAVYHILMTERYAYPIYSDNYGVELEQYIGREFSYLEATIETTLKEALLYDQRITDVKVTSTELTNTDVALVKFTVESIYGDLKLEVNISV